MIPATTKARKANAIHARRDVTGLWRWKGRHIAGVTVGASKGRFFKKPAKSGWFKPHYEGYLKSKGKKT